MLSAICDKVVLCEHTAIVTIHAMSTAIHLHTHTHTHTHIPFSAFTGNQDMYADFTNVYVNPPAVTYIFVSLWHNWSIPWPLHVLSSLGKNLVSENTQQLDTTIPHYRNTLKMSLN